MSDIASSQLHSLTATQKSSQKHQKMSLIRVAVLDDYQGFSKPLYGKLDPSRYEISYFPDTMRAYNRANTPDETKEALVERLKPFHVICKSLLLSVVLHCAHKDQQQ